ncbi:acetyl-CoA C-acyltransferase [Kordiimonas sp. SCSIO 12610]|uniref:thiolase family protein n=1 Tax=Kordiimonas sp. SCSIO 12610 TaxID=2829597 RepID=UPI00210AA1A2|nr:acetyl-CoA C-acyltransferase [Kordiimonas sp. SCSIO 12610]UTW53825.1 acetyl-CoA C-acyltransferase [Kordiimonas sp. SCSIO 12610]
MSKDPIVIVGMARTPMGGLLGDLSTTVASDLGATAIKGALDSAGVDGESIDETIMGCVLPAGQSQAPARQASKKAGIPDATGAVTINKMCGSGMKAMMQAHDALVAGSGDVIVAGGMESMSLAPHIMPTSRTGTKYGSMQVLDHMALDGLTDAYAGEPMGVFAEKCAEHYQFTREAQDAYAIESLKRAQRAIENGDFEGEVVPVTVKSRRGDTEIRIDEQPGKARLDKIPGLRPAFKKDGTVTAANASSISDGAAAVVMMRASEAEKRGLTPLATVKAHSNHAHEPEWFTTAPVKAVEKVLDKAGWTKDDVDLFELNEAFAVVPMAAMQELGLDHDKVNVNGGACALGHPIGASGARICVTLINALKKRGLKRGVASLCIGGGEATALALEVH